MYSIEQEKEKQRNSIRPQSQKRRKKYERNKN